MRETDSRSEFMCISWAPRAPAARIPWFCFSRCFLCGRHSTGHLIARVLLCPHFMDEETEAVNHRLSCHMVAKCRTWIQTLLWVLQSWFGWPGVSPRLYVWGPGVILRPFPLQLMSRVAGPEEDSCFQVPEWGSCCSSCRGLAANHIWEWPPCTPVITRVALSSWRHCCLPTWEGGFLEPA